MRGVLIPVDGDIREVEFDLTFDEPASLNTLIGGFVEPVRCPLLALHKAILLVDEEGRLKGLPRNVWASMLYMGVVIVGDAIVVGEGDDDFVSLDDVWQPDGRSWLELIRFITGVGVDDAD